MDTNDLLKQWRFRVHRMQVAHYDSAIHFERLNLLLGVPVIVLSTIVGTTIFATLEKSTSTKVQVIVGLLSVMAAVLASLQTFLRYSERAEKHRVVGAKFYSLKTEIERIIFLPPKEDKMLEEFVDSFRAKWSSLTEDTPTIPRNIWDGASKKVQWIESESTDSKATLLPSSDA